MSEELKVSELSKEEFLEVLFHNLAGCGMDRYKTSSDREFRDISDMSIKQDISDISDMFVKQNLGEARVTCHFFTKGLDIDEPEKDSRLTLHLNMSAKNEGIIEKYEYNDVALMPLGETLMEVLSQEAKKPFPKIRSFFAVMSACWPSSTK